MGILNWFKSFQKNKHSKDLDIVMGGKSVAVSGYISKEEGKGISFDEAKAMQEEIAQVLDENDSNKAFNMGCQLIMKQQYEEAIKVFEAVMEKDPDSTSACSNQMGACYFFLEDYEAAITHYLLAKKYGMVEDMIDFNVFESAEAAFNANGEKKFLELYLELFPEGDKRKEAEALLGV